MRLFELRSSEVSDADNRPIDEGIVPFKPEERATIDVTIPTLLHETALPQSDEDPAHTAPDDGTPPRQDQETSAIFLGAEVAAESSHMTLACIAMVRARAVDGIAEG